MTKKDTKEQAYCEILKGLLELGAASKLQLHKKLKDKIGSRITVGKRVDELAERGQSPEKETIKIQKGTRGPLGTHKCSIKLKGLMYLLIECKLEERELVRLLNHLFQTKSLEHIKPFTKTFSPTQISEIMSGALSELKSKVNLKYFDEKWAEEVFGTFFSALFEKHFCSEVANLKDLESGKTASEVYNAIKHLNIKKEVLAWADKELALAIIKEKQGKTDRKKYSNVIKWVKDVR